MRKLQKRSKRLRETKEFKRNRNILLSQSNGICRYCGNKFKKLTIDHIIPKRAEMEGIILNTDNIENLRLCCRDCNEFKLHYSLKTFRKRLLKLNDLKCIPSVIEVRIRVLYNINTNTYFTGLFYFEIEQKT